MAFLEPPSENRTLDFVRNYVPYPGKKSLHGHRGVTFPMLKEAIRSFATTKVRPFYLTAMLNRAFGHQTAITLLERLDDIVIARVPQARSLCRQVVVTFNAAR